MAKGNVILHAAPVGKDFLLDFYTKQGYTQIPPEAGEKISPSRPIDGGYFYMSPEDSIKYIKENRLLIEEPKKSDQIKSEPHLNKP